LRLESNRQEISRAASARSGKGPCSASLRSLHECVSPRSMTALPSRAQGMMGRSDVNNSVTISLHGIAWEYAYVPTARIMRRLKIARLRTIWSNRCPLGRVIVAISGHRTLLNHAKISSQATSNSKNLVLISPQLIFGEAQLPKQVSPSVEPC